MIDPDDLALKHLERKLNKSNLLQKIIHFFKFKI
jgi:hypothetical protein